MSENAQNAVAEFQRKWERLLIAPDDRAAFNNDLWAAVEVAVRAAESRGREAMREEAAGVLANLCCGEKSCSFAAAIRAIPARRTP